MPNGYIYTWTGKTSPNFGVASNWYNQSTGTAATSVPGINDEALINSNGVLSGSGNVFDLGLTGTGGTLTIAGALAGTNLFMASNVSVASGASLVFSNAIQIGDYDQYSIVSHTAANVAILAGGLIRGTLPTAGYYDFYVGVAGGTGTLSVSGQGALADAGARGFDVGDAGIGVISVGAGGSISGGTGDSYQSGVAEQLGITLGSPGGNGSLIVSGAGAGATFGDIVEVGYGGTGTISVQDGGTLTAGDGSFALDIADQQGNSVGAGSVSFAGGSGTLNGLVEVGTYGNGSLSLSAGATLTMTETSDSPSVTYWSAIAGVESGSSGTISVGSQSLLTTGHGLNIGVAGYGELDINGGQVALSSPTGGSDVALDIGLYAGSSGLVTVTAGLLQDVSDTGMIVGQSGSGTLDVNAGGTLICGGAEGFGGLFIGQDNGSSGTLAVGGAGATLTVTGQLQVASAGTGVFTLSGGAHASITSPSPNSLSSFVLGGNGGVGHATITGAGTVLNDTGQMLVGGTGTGTLTVTSGALLSVAAAAGQTISDAIIASASASVTSAVSVTGSGFDLVVGWRTARRKHGAWRLDDPSRRPCFGRFRDDRRLFRQRRHSRGRGQEFAAQSGRLADRHLASGKHHGCVERPGLHRRKCRHQRSAVAQPRRNVRSDGHSNNRERVSGSRRRPARSRRRRRPGPHCGERRHDEMHRPDYRLRLTTGGQW